MTVSTGLLVASWALLEFATFCAVCRMMKVKLNVRSSSLLSLSMKFGFAVGEDGSGSYDFHVSNVPSELHIDGAIPAHIPLQHCLQGLESQ